MMNMSKVGFVSLGCSKNLVDTEIMIGILKERGHNIVTDAAEADTIIINTCGFIDSAKEEAISTILEMSEYPARLIVTGCLAQRYKEEILKELPEVSCILGTGKIDEIAKAVEDADAKMFIGDGNAPYPEDVKRVVSTPPYTAYLKIAEGCSNHCTYCAIPSIRGPLRSRRIEDVVNEAKRLADEGVREISVIAQDTTRYGTDIYGEPKLCELLRELSKIDGIKWIRVLYTYPEMLSDELIEFVASCDKVASYFDIPLQHVSDKILRLMGRKSTGDGIRALINKIRSKIPDAVIRTTFIVGFPGETIDDFELLCDAVRELEFDKMGAFKFSPEEGTPAAKLSEAVHEDIKDYRYQELMDIQSGISLKKCREKIGKTLTVLVEGKNDTYYFGRTQKDSPEIDGTVYFKGEKAVPGDFVKVKITDAEEYDLIGEMINEFTE